MNRRKLAWVRSYKRRPIEQLSNKKAELRRRHKFDDFYAMNDENQIKEMMKFTTDFMRGKQNGRR